MLASFLMPPVYASPHPSRVKMGLFVADEDVSQGTGEAPKRRKTLC